MFNCTRIHDVTYYDDQAAEAARMAAKREAALGYYDNEVDKPGIFVKIRHAGTTKANPFRDIATGDIANSIAIRRLAAGQDPRTGQQLTRETSAANQSRRGQRRRKVVGYDLQISAPKSVSVLYALGSQKVREAILSAHGRAFLIALRIIEAQGLIITRTGAGSRVHEPASETVAALYTHVLSRDLDPQLHTHAVIPNICVRADGKIGAIDNHRLKCFGGAIAALYRCELAAILRAELGVEVGRDKRNFKLPIIPDELARVFAKRRAAIVAGAEKAGFDTADNRSRAQKLSYDTRARKQKDLSLAELLRDWRRQALAAGFDHAAILAPVEARLSLGKASALPVRAPVVDAKGLLGKIFANESLRTWPQILCFIAEEMQLSLSAEAVLETAETVRASLIAVDRTMEGDAVYTSEAMIRTEHEFLRLAGAGRNNWRGLSPAMIEAALAKDTFLSTEQRDAVVHALGPDAVVAIEGPPGAGKSRMSAAINTVAKAAGLDLRVTSVSWQATHVVRHDAGVPAERADALTPLLLALDQGKVTLSARDVIIVDEAGMAGLAQIADLTRHCHRAGAKLMFVGDTGQLQPVAAGAPMRALTQLLGRGALHMIRRQEAGWMRQASMDLAAGRPERAIDSYDAAGAIAVHSSRDVTLATAADDYMRPLPASQSGLNAALRRQLLITSRNDDVAELNRMVRERLRDGGQLGSDEIIVHAFRRNARDGEPAALALSRGDRIMFGERVKLGNITLYNADIAKIMWIEPGADGPIVTLALDRTTNDGQPITFTRPWKDLVARHGKRGAPVAQHAYALTVHAAQGATVDRTIVAMTTAMNAEPLFVAMTRHRKDLSIHVDADLGQPSLTAERIALSRSGRLRGTDEAPDQPSTKGEDFALRNAALAALKLRAARSTPVDNPSRYVHDLNSWIANEDGVSAFRRQLAVSQPLASFKARLNAAMASRSPINIPDRDPLALSRLERQQLDGIALDSDRAVAALGVVRDQNGLHDAVTQERLLLRDGQPQWSAIQAQRLAAAHASGEHVFIQIAIAVLRKSLRAARSFVRTAFALSGLNPLAAAVLRRAREIAERASAPSPASGRDSLVLDSTRRRQLDEAERDDATREKRRGRLPRLAAAMRRLRDTAPLAAGTDKGNAPLITDAQARATVALQTTETAERSSPGSQPSELDSFTVVSDCRTRHAENERDDIEREDRRSRFLRLQSALRRSRASAHLAAGADEASIADITVDRAHAADQRRARETMARSNTASLESGLDVFTFHTSHQMRHAESERDDAEREKRRSRLLRLAAASQRSHAPVRLAAGADKANVLDLPDNRANPAVKNKPAPERSNVDLGTDIGQSSPGFTADMATDARPTPHGQQFDGPPSWSPPSLDTQDKEDQRQENRRKRKRILNITLMRAITQKSRSLASAATQDANAARTTPVTHIFGETSQPVASEKAAASTASPPSQGGHAEPAPPRLTVPEPDLPSPAEAARMPPGIGRPVGRKVGPAPHVSSNSEISARASRRIVEYGIDPTALPTARAITSVDASRSTALSSPMSASSKKPPKPALPGLLGAALDDDSGSHQGKLDRNQSQSAMQQQAGSKTSAPASDQLSPRSERPQNKGNESQGRG